MTTKTGISAITNLDLVDRRLLYELDGNSRLSTSDLARRLVQGRDRIEYRLERLSRNNILKQCTVTINPYRLGLTLYKTYLKVDQKHSEFEKILNYLDTHPRVYWIADCDGRWDLIFSTFARSPFEFHAIQQEILSKFSSLVISSSVFTLVNVWMNRKGYLVGKASASFLLGGPPETISIDAFEWKLLRLLSKDARLSIVDLSQRLKSTEAIVKYRLARLEQAGLIVGYRAEINLTQINMMFFKAQLYLREYNKYKLKALRQFCEKHPNITYFIEQLGECDVEMELEVPSYHSYTAILNDIRREFGDLIKNIETVLINRSWFKWVPYETATTES
jgi:Lrp/AsnC family leucine-responsive transcriptional regulator